MTNSKDHDTLIRIDENVKVIVKDIARACKERKELYKENQIRKDWQENHDTREKMVIAVASGIGGFLVFLATKVIDWFIDKKI